MSQMEAQQPATNNLRRFQFGESVDLRQHSRVDSSVCFARASHRLTRSRRQGEVRRGLACGNG